MMAGNKTAPRGESRRGQRIYRKRFNNRHLLFISTVTIPVQSIAINTIAPSSVAVL